MTKNQQLKEKIDTAVTWLRNALVNLENIERGIPLFPIVKEQISNTIKLLEGEKLDDDVLGK